MPGQRVNFYHNGKRHQSANVQQQFPNIVRSSLNFFNFFCSVKSRFKQGSQVEFSQIDLIDLLKCIDSLLSFFPL